MTLTNDHICPGPGATNTILSSGPMNHCIQSSAVKGKWANSYHLSARPRWGCLTPASQAPSLGNLEGTSQVQSHGLNLYLSVQCCGCGIISSHYLSTCTSLICRHKCPNHLCDSSHSLKGLDKENPLLLQPCARPNHLRQPKIQAPLSASDLCFGLRHQNHVCILRYPMVLFPICLHFMSLWGSLVAQW